MIELFIFLLGLLIGSFLNVCIYRIPEWESVASSPYHCTSCHYQLRWYDFFPVLSWTLLRGRCRQCGEKISWRYFLVELITGVLLMMVYFKYGFSLEFFKYAILIGLLIIIGMIDLDTTDVYLKTTLTGILFGIMFMFIGKYLAENTLDYIYGSMLGGGLISLIIVTTRGMGWGDAEICFMCGLFLGVRLTLFMIFLSFVIGGIVSVLLILFKRKARRDYIPFGPYISLATFITILCGEKILGWYFSML